LPESLNTRGGFLNPDIAEWFADYASLLYQKFGDRVKKWATINEPLSMANNNYCSLGAAVHPPGNFTMQCQWVKYQAGHNMLRAHAKAYRAYDLYRWWQHGEVGIVLSTGWYNPSDNSPANVSAANRARDFAFGWFADPVFKGDYPQSMKDGILARSLADGYVDTRLPTFTPFEKYELKGSADWLGINYYYGFKIWERLDFPYGIAQEQRDGATVRQVLVPYPDGLRQILNYAWQTYHVPLMVTENGANTEPGQINDPSRILNTANHINAVIQARNEGTNVRGYTYWSLMDNFEWTSGYTSKFGMFLVDFTSPDRTRTPKASATWYKGVIATNQFQVCTA